MQKRVGTYPGRSDGIAMKDRAKHKSVMDLVLRPEWVFLVLFLVFSTAATLLVPMGAGPDEPSHIARVEQIADGVMVTPTIEASQVDRDLAKVADTSQPVYGGFQDYGLIHTAVQNMRSYQGLMSLYSFPAWSASNLVTGDRFGEQRVGFAFSNSAVNSPLVYLPQVLFFRLAGLFTHSAWWLIFAMRMGGILTLALAIFLCIRAIPVGKWFMAVFGILPSTILTNTALTADTITTVCCLALITAFMVAWMREGPVSRLTWGVLAVSSVSMGMAKLSYLPLVFLLLLLPMVRPELRTRRTWAWVGGIVLASLVIFLVWYMEIGGVNTGVLFDSAVKPAQQKKFILGHPLFYAKNELSLFLMMDFFQVSNFGILSMRGTSLECGWIYLILMAIALFVPDPRERPLNEGRSGIWWVISAFILEYLVMFVLISTALYLQFTPVGAPYIAGVQNRYFIPIMPLLLLSVLLLARWILAPRIDPEPGEVRLAAAESRDRVLIRILSSGMAISILVMMLNLLRVVYDKGIIIR